MKKWQLQEAKNRLSEVVRKAAEEGPQVVTLRGDDAVVVIEASAYRKLVRAGFTGSATIQALKRIAKRHDLLDTFEPPEETESETE